MAVKKVVPMPGTVAKMILDVIDNAEIRGRDAQMILLMKQELSRVTAVPPSQPSAA